MNVKNLIIFWELYQESLRDRTGEFKEFWKQLFNSEPYGE